MAWDQELDEFKTAIDLRAYAASIGYALDRRESWRGSAVMRKDGDKIVIKRDGDGHYVYFSVRDDRDHGTIIDFIQFRKRASLGEVRKDLRSWLGRPESPLPAFAPLEKTVKDRLRVETEYRRMQEARRHPYLERERRIPADLLGSWRFAGRIRIDARRNAVFAHFDEGGLCGYELKNRNFTGFAKGGEKGLWTSNRREDDHRLVFAETAIDGLSHAALRPDERARYASIGGQLNPKQPGLIRDEILSMPACSQIVSAMDNDPAGHSLSKLIASAVETSGRSDLAFIEDLPEAEGSDWNDVLKERMPPARFSPRSEFSPRPVAARPSLVPTRRPVAPKPPGF
jgi:hypothetical protein